MQRLPRLFRFLLLAAAAGVVIMGLLRAAFFLAFNNPADPAPWPELAQAFWLGLRYDLRVALVLLLPLALFGGLPRLSPFGSAAVRRFWSGYMTLATSALLLIYAVDFGHYAYLSMRVDISVLRFLRDAQVSAQMVWESYPVVWIALGLAAATAAIAWSVDRLFRRIAAQPAPALGWRRRAGFTLLAFVLILGGLYGKFSWYPLRWSDAYFSTHNFVPAVAVNPLHYFLDTRKNGGVTYDAKKVRGSYALMADYLGVDHPDEATLDLTRHVNAATSSRPNIVVVQIESFASYKNSLSGNPLDPTPRFAALAHGGVYFPNFFVPHTGTAHAVFAVTTGIPDVETNGTSSRNPVIVDQHTLINDLPGYERFYFLGGSASWGNIRGLLSHNIDGLHIYEEGSYASPRVDVWGISDLSLFEEANKVLGEQRKPFFAYIQTSGGHRPYTIPADNRGFEIKHPGDTEVQKYGFISEGEYNSYRFMDHAIGCFIEDARKQPWFDNTIFVFFGDHGIGGDGGRHVPASETQLDITHFRVPLVIYAPKRLKPRVVQEIGSQVDVLPTVTRLAGQSYDTRTLGRDLFDIRYDKTRYAFTIDHSRRTPTVGLIDPEGFVFRMGMDGREAKLYRLDSANPRDDLAAKYPQQFAAMKELTTSIYETAKYMLYHNGSDQAANTSEGKQAK
jgi:phosphoglycerol transferase MdoB-like AlkP superfamily enzyme